MNHKEKAIKVTWLSIFGNLFLALVKGVTGYFGNSYALIADAVESSTDIVSSFLVLIGLRYSTRPPDEDHPYGHGKIEFLAAGFEGGLILLAGGSIMVRAVQGFVHPLQVK